MTTDQIMLFIGVMVFCVVWLRFNMVKPTTTKQCACGNRQLVRLSTLKQKRCTDCGAVIKWTKEKGESDYYG